MPRRHQRGHVDQKISRQKFVLLHRERAKSYPRCRLCGRKLSATKRLEKYNRHRINRPYGDLCARCAKNQILLSLLKK